MGPIIINVFCMLNGFFKQDHDLSSFMANKIFDSIILSDFPLGWNNDRY